MLAVRDPALQIAPINDAEIAQDANHPCQKQGSCQINGCWETRAAQSNN